ncbi:hypothetical protein GALL_497540 [mine drainage metagenome]|uniref:Uncharacterized protein n=1 Tax=mine drainage metagenome TaxID=410659 RepID=A0A1J5PBS4_9ZZZZ
MRRIPDRLINPVENAAQITGANLQQPVKTATLLGCLDFAGITGADGSDVISIKKSGLHERHLSMKLQPLHVKSRHGQTKFNKLPMRKKPLVSQVMHGVDTGDPVVFGRQISHVGRRKRGVPVMAVHHLHRPVDIKPVRQLRRQPAQQGEAAVIVGKRLALCVFVGGAGPAVQRRRINHVGHQIQTGQTALAQQQSLTPGRTQLGQHRAGAQISQNRRKAGQQDAHIAALGSQGPGQRAGHIGQPSGLEQGVNLGTNLQYVQLCIAFYESRASMSRVISTTPLSVRSKRCASSSASSPTTKPSGRSQPRSTTTLRKRQ